MFWVLIVVSAILLWQLVVRAGGGGLPETEIDFSAFLNQVDQGNVKEVTIT
ncbi:MAG: ATP-dependent metallopeptidase FtsH/Yme1/Tma family protein, partial [Terriglobales bacterium]